MKDRCTPATAARLKAAGFPQPDPAPGQVWYKGEYAYCVTEVDGLVRLTGIGFSGKYTTWDINIDLVYAPTAPYILRELGLYWSLWCEDYIFRLSEDDSLTIYKHPNPAEACAVAWEEEQKT